MPDISMCNSDICPLKDKCHRNTARPSKFMQSYFTEAPFQIIDGETKCECFWDNKKDSCKGVKKEGESCSFNNRCTYPNCNYMN